MRGAARPNPNESYRIFLERRLALEKENDPQFTLAKLAEHLGLSTSNLSMIVSGKRNLQVTSLLKLAKALRWNAFETDLFESMMRRDDAASEEERVFYSERVHRLWKALAKSTPKGHSDRLQHVQVSLPSARLLDKWFYPAVVVFLLDAQNAQPGGLEALTQTVAKRFGIPVAEANAILLHMKELGLLELADEAGKGRLHVNLSRLTHSLSERKHVRSVLKEAERIVEARYKSQDCFFTSAAFSSPQDALPALVESYKAWLDGVASAPAGSNTKNLRVFQSSFAFFSGHTPRR